MTEAEMDFTSESNLSKPKITNSPMYFLKMNIQGLFPLGLTGLISLLSKGLSKVFSNNTIQKH